MRNYQLHFNRAAAVLTVLLFCGFQAFAVTASGIRRPGSGETVEVLVQYASQPTEDAHRRITSLHGRVRAAFKNVPVAHYDVTQNNGRLEVIVP